MVIERIGLFKQVFECRSKTMGTRVSAVRIRVVELSSGFSLSAGRQGDSGCRGESILLRSSSLGLEDW